MKKVVVAMDSFKGCLSSTEAEKAAEEGVKQVCPDCEVICFPIADGGEGMLDVLVEATEGASRFDLPSPKFLHSDRKNGNLMPVTYPVRHRLSHSLRYQL